MKNLILEACIEILSEAVKAEKNGANRLELCSRLDLDGLTPDEDLILQVVEKVKIPVKVIIRPKAGNFLYSESELEEMKDSIRFCKKMKVRGVVFGILDETKNLNLDQIQKLAELASPLEVTIHKAIDQTPDLLKSVAELSRMKSITSILTSGGTPTAFEGSEMLKKMIQLAGGSLKIIPAGSITHHNMAIVHKIIGAEEYHGRRIVGDQR